METHKKTGYTVSPINGVLNINHLFNDEQEHSIHIYKGEACKENKQCIIHLYSLYEDLYEKRPYKGDFHSHSNFSDGKETPEFVCAANRKAGLDFITITDHRCYYSSLKAKEFVRNLETDFIVYQGEEIHFHGHEHILSFGNKEGLSDKYEDEEIFEKEILKYSKDIENEINILPKNIDVGRYVACRFVIDKIREADGLAIMPHPNLVQDIGYHNTSHLFKYLYENNYLDVCELINGYAGERDRQDANILQVAYYEDQRAKGIEMPIVSGTDAHTIIQNNCIGNMYTVVFCESLEIEQLRKNILEGNTAVVDRTIPYAFGELRFVKYTLYLIREIFPLHDEICYEEGETIFEPLLKKKNTILKAELIACIRIYGDK